MEKTTSLIILFLFVAVLKTFLEKRYTIFITFLMLIIVIVFIQSLPFKKCYNTFFTIIVFILYYKNIMLCTDLSLMLLKLRIFHPSHKRYDNELPRYMVTRHFHRHFNFHHNLDKISTQQTIFVSNYVSDRFENIACIMIPNTSILLGKVFVDKIKLHTIVRNVIRKKSSKDQYDNLKQDIQNNYNKGLSIFSYVEEPSSAIGEYSIGRLRSGMFSIARELNIPITPVVFDHVKHNWIGIIPIQNYFVKVGKPFFVEDVKKAKYITRKFFRDTLQEFRKRKFTPVFNYL